MEQPKQTTDTPQEETIFNEADWNMQGYDKHIRNARIMLYIVAGLQLLPLLLLPEGLDDDARNLLIILQVIFAAVFVGLAIWTKYKPFAALLTAMIFFLGIWVLGGILNPASIFSGIILKVILIVLLILGIRNAKEAEELKKTYGR
jgi:hypothetical protein